MRRNEKPKRARRIFNHCYCPPWSTAENGDELIRTTGNAARVSVQGVPWCCLANSANVRRQLYGQHLHSAKHSTASCCEEEDNKMLCLC